MKPRIKVIDGEISEQVFKLEPDGEIVFGRDRSLEGCLPEQKISRRHARFVWQSTANQVIVEDLGSLNGTYLNGERIRGETALDQGDVIRIGSHHLMIDLGEMSMSQASEPEEFNLSMKTASGEDRISSSFRNTQESGSKDISPPQELDLHSADDAEEAFQALSDANIDVDELNETAGRIIQGKLSELGLPDVLQMLATTRKNGALALSEKKLKSLPSQSDAKTGIIYIQDGQLEFAEYRGLTNEEAFYALLKMQQGYFALFTSNRKDFPSSIQTPVEALLIEGLRRLDEEKAAIHDLSDTDLFDVRPDEPLSELSKEELLVFQLAWKHQSMKAISERAPYDKELTKEIVKKLIRNGFLIRAS